MGSLVLTTELEVQQQGEYMKGKYQIEKAK